VRRITARNWRAASYNVDAFRQQARAVLPRAVFDFADGGAEKEWTLRRNEAAFDDVALMPRPLRGASERDQSVTLLGSHLSMPVIIGPTGLAGLFWPGGELCSARAAARQGTAYCLSHGSVCRLEELAAMTQTPRWMQVFIYKDRQFSWELARRAKAAGYSALVLTIDNQLLGNRERDIRNGFAIPPRLGASGIARMALKARWLLRMRGELPRITFANYVRPGESTDIAALAGRMAQLLDPAMSWADVDALREVWDGPLILKGIMHPQEAREAVERGIDAIIVSNHGGRQLDGAAGALDVLPAMVEAVGGRMPVLLDGGVRRGSDVLKALALGATACLIGRPQLWALATAGEEGVSRLLDIYRREIDRAMGLCGLRSLSEIGPDILIHRQQWLRPLQPDNQQPGHAHDRRSPAPADPPPFFPPH
jgi:isopentenyl diphosphate isomerase/L-lactate dehydrogenase-like FMN-dependent dehydrogenase